MPRTRKQALTPVALARLQAEINGPYTPGHTVYDPTCGTGTLLIGVAQAIRAADGNPADYEWVGQDLDPLAVALCGINMVSRGFGVHCRLYIGDTLTDPGFVGPAGAAAS